MYRGLGSIDFTAACRSVLMVGFDPDDADTRVVAHAKSNLEKMGPSQSYTIKAGRFAWAGRSSLSAEDLSGPPPDADQRSTKGGEGVFAPDPRGRAETRARSVRRRRPVAHLPSFPAPSQGGFACSLGEDAGPLGMEPAASANRAVRQDRRCAGPWE
jgi:hypothetical protein